MPPKPKPNANKKPSVEEEAKARADAVDDIYDDEFKKTLRIECRKLEDMIKKEEGQIAHHNDERLRINYFWLVGKKELEDKQAELRNKEREFQDLEEKHKIEIKIYKQRLKHLVFQNQDQLTQLKKDSQITLKNIEDEHRITERELKQDIRALKVAKKEQEVRHAEYLNALIKHYNQKKTDIRKEYERISFEIQVRFKHKMLLLRNDKEKRRKQEIERIENKKNKAIRDLTSKHEKKYSDIKDYYSEITNTNMDIIRQLKDDLTDATLTNQKTQTEKNTQELRNQQVAKPLEEANKAVKEYEKEKIKHVEIQNKLQDCQQKIMLANDGIDELEWEYEVKLQNMQYLEKEKQELYDEFHRLVYELHRKTGLRNLILEKKNETIVEANETKDAQIN